MIANDDERQRRKKKNEEKTEDEEQEKGTGILLRGYLKAKNSAPLNRCAVKRKTKQNKKQQIYRRQDRNLRQQIFTVTPPGPFKEKKKGEREKGGEKSEVVFIDLFS